MTGMEHAIEQAARIIHGCTGDEDGAPVAARALAEAGLLAPAPLTEEHTLVYSPAPGTPAPHDLTLEEQRAFMEQHGTRQRRYVSDWMSVDRAEGDGRTGD